MRYKLKKLVLGLSLLVLFLPLMLVNIANSNPKSSFYAGWDNAGITIGGDGLTSSFINLLNTLETPQGSFLQYANNSVHYVTNDEINKSEPKTCMIRVTISVNDADTSKGNMLVSRVDVIGGENRACSTAEADEAIRKFSNKQIDIANTWTDPRPNSSASRTVTVNVVPIIEGAAQGDAIDASKIPETDTVTIKSSNLSTEIARVQASRNIIASSGPSPPGVNYSATFSNIATLQTGTQYQACSEVVLKNTCIRFTKTTNIDRVQIIGDTSNALEGAIVGSLEEGSAPEQSCEDQNQGGFGWVICGFVNLADAMVSSLFGVAEELLNIETQKIRDDEGGQLKAMWSYFRAIATFMLLAVGMVMVISQAIGGRP